MANYDTVISGGMVVDGTRPRRLCDVAIRDGKIARLGRIAPDHADKVIDARGHIVVSG